MTESKAISIRVPDILLKKIDLLAEEKYKSHKGTPNRSLVVLDAIVAYFNTLSDTNNLKDIISVSDSVGIEQFNELQTIVATLSDTVESLKHELIALSDSVLKLNEAKPDDKIDRRPKHTQLTTMGVSDTVINAGLTTITVSDTVMDDGLTTNQLAERIGSTNKVILKERGRHPEFPSKFLNWVIKKDPDGFGWEYKEESGLFHKVEPLA